MRALPGQLASTWLLARLRLVRRVNLMLAMFGRFGRQKARGGTAAKRKTNWAWTILIVVAFAVTAINMSSRGVLTLHAALDVARTAFSPISAALARGLAAELSLLLVATLCVGFSARELAQPDWDLEWLVTLPLRTDTILWARVAERTITEPFGWFWLAPLCGAIAWYSGYRWSAPLLGVVGAVPLLALGALVRTAMETWLRLSLPRERMRNAQATLGLVGTVLLLFAMAPALPTSGGLIGVDLLRGLPDWIKWTPPGLVVQLLGARDSGSAFSSAGLLAAEVAVVLILGVRLLRHQLRDGVVNHGVRESGRKRMRIDAGVVDRPSFLNRFPVLRRELTQLRRDRNFQMQTLIVPVVPAAIILFMHLSGGDTAAGILGGARGSAAIAFGMAAYVLQFSALQTLNTEGSALWLLYSFPRSIESVLKEKARLWAGIAMIYPIAVLAAAAFVVGDSGWRLLGYGALTLVGVPIYAMIAVALSVFANDPLAVETQRRIRISYAYLYLTLAGIFVYALSAVHWWQTLVFVVLTVLLALALWQKARDELPYLLDPTASPPARVSASDGLIAAMVFFVLQSAILLVLSLRSHEVQGTQILGAFVGAGAFTYAAMRFTYWRAKTQFVPVMFGRDLAQPVRDGLIGGLVAAVVGIGYLVAVPQELLRAPPKSLSLGLLLYPLAVLAAPVFEEFIFRGLIFGGLRRSIGIVPAVVASAAVFAVVHPPASMVPVFVLGICAAVVYERSKVLLAPMIAHALYNAIVITYQVVAPG